MRHYSIIGNWKLHQGPKAAARLVQNIQKQLKPHTHVTAVVCPPFVSLAAVGEVLEKDLLRLGAQNLFQEDEGAYTGEVSAPMLREVGVEYVIVGHSERRRIALENDKLIARKLAAAVRSDLRAILCVGEKLHDRQEGHSKRVVVDQLHGSLSQLTAEDLPNLLIAYEPVWAISTGDGHGKTALPEDVTPIAAAIRQTFEEMFGEAASSQVEILYGGSSNADNARAFLELELVDGLLVGGDSLNFEHFAKVVTIAQELADKAD
jgi:triosephosphate isomerase